MPTGEPAGTGPTARRMVLGSQLRRLREAKGISREDAGYAIRGSGSKISRVELGRVSFKERDVADLLTLYGISDERERDLFLALVRESNQPGWWQRYNDLMPHWFQDFIGLEESASRIQTYETSFIPGLMQTEAYARAVMVRGRPDAPPEEIDRRVNLRMQRQRLLQSPQAPRLWAVIEEACIHRQIGGRKVLRAQLEHLMELTRMSNGSLQAVPFDLGGPGAGTALPLPRCPEP